MNKKLELPLFFIRITVALVLLVWTFDKFVNVDHAVRVYEHFYFLPWVGENLMQIIGLAELVLVVLFVIGRLKDVTYLIVLIIHGVSTVTPMMNYFDPYNGNLLFFAAWPMLAACYMLYVFRHEDTRFNF